MNASYLLAGAASTNPILFAITTCLVLAWNTAGWIGPDHWGLPALGTPGVRPSSSSMAGALLAPAPGFRPSQGAAIFPDTGEHPPGPSRRPD